MIIRKALPSDYEAMAALEKEVFMLHYENRPDMFRYRSEPLTRARYDEMLIGKHIVLLAEGEGGAVVGQAVALRRGYKDHPVFNDFEWLEIDDISVRSDARGRGVGKALFEAVKAEAKAMGLARLELTVWGFNGPARAFYEKMGMRSRIDRLEMDV